MLSAHAASIPCKSRPCGVGWSPAFLAGLVLCGLTLALPATVRGQDDARPDLPTPDQLNMHVIPGGETIKVDGILDEEVWQRAVPATTFWQYAPLDRVPATENTEVRVVQDDRALFFAVICHDSDPTGIIAQDMRRDAPLSNDDYVGIYLDTYHDHRNFYYFSTNSLGTRRDGIVTDARSYNTAWNGIWQVKTQVTATGWTAEFRIPFSTLRFGGDQPMTWGLQLSRAVRRKQESDFWAPIPRWLGGRATWRAERFGQLIGIRTDAAYAKWEAEPYVLGGGSRGFRPSSSDPRLNTGGDILYDFTPNLRGTVSIRTDFAQVEADQEVINFTRFPLFFPERRDFFLEDAGLFTVGLEQEMMMFYSRRIGLSDGRQVPILAAGKLSGRVGQYSVGVMNVQTDEADVSRPGGSRVSEPRTNYSVIRVKRNLFTNSSIGAIVTNKQSSEHEFRRLAGLDGNVWFSPSLKGEMLLARTFNSAGVNDDSLGIGRLMFSKQNTVADVRYYAVGRDFSPAMGFVAQNDLRRSSAEGGYTHWINRQWRAQRHLLRIGHLRRLLRPRLPRPAWHGRRRCDPRVQRQARLRLQSGPGTHRRAVCGRPDHHPARRLHEPVARGERREQRQPTRLGRRQLQPDRLLGRSSAGSCWCRRPPTRRPTWRSTSSTRTTPSIIPAAPSRPPRSATACCTPSPPTCS